MSKLIEFFFNGKCITVRSLFLSKMSRLMTKPTKWHVPPAKTQISLGICPVWSVFAVRMKKAWVLSYPLRTQRRLWSDWADAQADPSLHWAHMPFCWFCREAAQMLLFKAYDSRLSFLAQRLPFESTINNLRPNLNFCISFFFFQIILLVLSTVLTTTQAQAGDERYKEVWIICLVYRVTTSQPEDQWSCIAYLRPGPEVI